MIIWTRGVISGPLRKGNFSFSTSSFSIRHLRPLHLLLKPGSPPTSTTSFWSKIFIISFDCPLFQARPSDIGWTIRTGLSCAVDTSRRVAAENQGPNRVPRITLHSLCIICFSLFPLPVQSSLEFAASCIVGALRSLAPWKALSLPSHLIPLGQMKPILRYPLFSFTVST